MRNLTASAVLGALVLAAMAPAPLPADDATKGKLEILARILPDGVEQESGLRDLERLVERAGTASGLSLTGWSARPEPLQESASEASLPVSLVATFDPKGAAPGPDDDNPGFHVRTLVDALGRGSRLIVFDWLELSAPPEGELRLAGVARLHYTPPSLPQGTPEERLRAKVGLIVDLKARAPWPLRRLQRLADAGRALVFTSLRLETARIAARGLVPWPSEAASFRVEGLDPTRFEWQRRGSCQAFDLEAGISADAAAVVEGQPVEEPPADDGRLRFGWPGEAYCAGPIAVERRLPPVRLAGKGPLTLRARDVDLAQVVWLLHHEAGQAVVVDGTVHGALDVDFSAVTLDEAMAALKRYGVFASRADRIRLVTAKLFAGLVAARPPRVVSPVSFSLTEVPFASVLHILEDLSGDRVVLTAPEPPPATIYAQDLPWDEVYDALFAANGLAEEQEGGLISVRPRSGSAVPAASPRDVGLPHRIRNQDVIARQFELAAISSSKGASTAWMRTPRGTLLDYRAGDRCFDCTVKSVEAEQVTLGVEIGDPLAPEKVHERQLPLPPVR